MAYSSLTVVNMLNQLFLIFILLHYLLNGSVDRKQQICLKSKTWEVKIHSYFTDAHLDLSIDSATGQTLFAIGINSVRSLVLEWLSDETKPVDAIFSLNILLNMALNWFWGVSTFTLYLPNYQQWDTWESTLFITSVEALDTIAVCLCFNLLLKNDGYIMEQLQRIDRVIIGWNRHEDEWITSSTLVSMVIQTLLICTLVRNYSIWWTQPSDENLKTFTYKTFNLLAFDLEINYTLFLNTVFVFTSMLISLFLLLNSPELGLKDCIVLLLVVAFSRLFIVSYNYLVCECKDFTLHGQLHHIHANFNGAVNLFQAYNNQGAIEELLNDLNEMVPDPKRVDISSISKEEYYFGHKHCSHSELY